MLSFWDSQFNKYSKLQEQFDYNPDESVYNRFINKLFKDMNSFMSDEKNKKRYLKKVKPGSRELEYMFKLDPRFLQNFTTEIDISPWQIDDKSKSKEYPIWYMLASTPVKSWIKSKNGSLNVMNQYPEFFSCDIKNTIDAKERRKGKFNDELLNAMTQSIIDYKFCIFVFSDWCEHYEFKFKPENFNVGLDLIVSGEIEKKKPLVKPENPPKIVVLRGKKVGEHQWEINESLDVLDKADICGFIDLDIPDVDIDSFKSFRELDHYVSNNIANIKFKDIILYHTKKDLPDDNMSFVPIRPTSDGRVLSFDERLKLKL